MAEPTRIFVVRGLPNGTSTWLTVTSGFFTEREDVEREVEFYEKEFPNWEWGTDTYTKEDQ